MILQKPINVTYEFSKNPLRRNAKPEEKNYLISDIFSLNLDDYYKVSVFAEGKEWLLLYTLDSVPEFLKDKDISYKLLAHEYRDDEWKCINFNIYINDEMFEYHVGIGHLKKIDLYNCKPDKMYISAYEDIIKDQLRYAYFDYKPNIRREYHNYSIEWLDVIGIIFNLRLDMTNETFENWCDELSYNSDSIRDNEMYKQCLSNTLKMNRIFTCSELEEIAELEC